MKIIRDKIELQELKDMAEKSFGNFVKAVVDVEEEIMAVDAELHSDEEALLLENGSNQKHLWGINLYTDIQGEDFIEFDSMPRTHLINGSGCNSGFSAATASGITKSPQRSAVATPPGFLLAFLVSLENPKFRFRSIHETSSNLKPSQGNRELGTQLQGGALLRGKAMPPQSNIGKGGLGGEP